MKLFFRIRGVRSVQHHSGPTVQAVDQPNIFCASLCQTLSMLSNILYNFSGLLRNKYLIRILKAEPLNLRPLNAFFILEGQRGRFVVDIMAQVGFILQNALDSVARTIAAAVLCWSFTVHTFA